MRIAFILTVLTMSLSLNAQCDREQDSLALVDLYNSANGINWDTSWVLDQPMDTWYGVFLNSEGCVECLDLDGYANCELDFLFSPSQYILNIIGTLPPSLQNLSSIKKMFFNRAGISSEFPDWITSMESLEQLAFRQCSMPGIIPEDIDQLTNLTLLHLGSNNLTGEIPSSIGNLANLELLFLFANNLSGTLPSSIGNLSNLKRTILSFNPLTGEIPPEYGALDSLTQLVLSNTNLTGNIPVEFETMQSLISLNVSEAQHTGEVQGFLANMPSIGLIDLSENNLHGCIPEEILNSCDDINYDFRLNPLLAFTGDINEACASEPGDVAPCDDGYQGTSNDSIQDDCSCQGELTPLECLCDIAGFYNGITSPTNESGLDGWCDNEVWSGTVEIVQDQENSYLIYTTSPNGDVLEDMSIGSYYTCYGADAQSNLPNGSGFGDYLTLVVDCDTIYFDGESQWGEIYSMDSISFANDEFYLAVSNDAGEAWTSILTKQSGDGFPEENVCYLDEDGDGFTSDIDCNDIDPTINPDAIEILDNGIDEDCNGMDLSNVLDLNDISIRLYPNPTTDYLHIDFDYFNDLSIKMYNTNGTFVQIIDSAQTDISQLADGLYFIILTSKESGQSVTAKIIKQ